MTGPSDSGTDTGTGTVIGLEVALATQSASKSLELLRGELQTFMNGLTGSLKLDPSGAMAGIEAASKSMGGLLKQISTISSAMNSMGSNATFNKTAELEKDLSGNHKMVAAELARHYAQLAEIEKDHAGNQKMVAAENKKHYAELAELEKDFSATQKMVSTELKRHYAQIDEIERDHAGNQKMVAAENAKHFAQLGELEKDSLSTLAMVAAETKQHYAKLDEIERDHAGNRKMVEAENLRHFTQLAEIEKDSLGTNAMIATELKSYYAKLDEIERDHAGNRKMVEEETSRHFARMAEIEKDSLGTNAMVEAENKQHYAKLAEIEKDHAGNRKMVEAETARHFARLAEIEKDSTGTNAMIAAERKAYYAKLDEIDKDHAGNQKMVEAETARHFAKMAELEKDRTTTQKMVTAAEAPETKFKNLQENIGVKQLQLGSSDTIGQLKLTLELERGRLALMREQGQTLVNNFATLSAQGSVIQKLTAELKEQELIQSRAASHAANKDRIGSNGGADLFSIQASLYMNYAVMNTVMSGLRDASSEVVKFEAEMKNLQAITGSTNLEMDKLGSTFLKVAGNSKFSGTDIAKAGTTMAQAGMSPGQIEETIVPVLRLATATGTDLKTSVDIATSAMGVFNLRAAEMGNVADIVSAALNVSKLDAEKFALILQYAGNTAEMLNVSLVDLTAAAAMMSNTGIKSGSTMGTGLQQIMKELSAPSDKMVQTLQRLGLSVADVDIKSVGLITALTNLRDAGFTTSQALESMDVRTAKAMAAMLNQLSKADDIRQQIALGGDAAKAAETQMDSLDGASKRAGNAFTSLAAASSGPLLSGLKALATVFGDLFNAMKGASDIIGGVLAVALAGLTVSITGMVGKLAFGLFAPMLGNLTAMISLLRVATTVTEAWSVAMMGVGKGNIIMLGLTVALAAATYAWEKHTEGLRKASEEMEKTQARLNASKNALQESQTGVASITQEIAKLATQHATLNSSSSALASVTAELNAKFKDMGFYLSSAGNSVETTIEKLEQLRQKQLQIQKVNLQGRVTDFTTQIDQTEKQVGAYDPEAIRKMVEGSSELKGAGFNYSPKTRFLGGGGEKFSGSEGPVTDEIRQTLAMLKQAGTMNRDKLWEGTVSHRENLSELGKTTQDPKLKAAIDFLVLELDKLGKAANSVTSAQLGLKGAKQDLETTNFQSDDPLAKDYNSLIKSANYDRGTLNKKYAKNNGVDAEENKIREMQVLHDELQAKADKLKADNPSKMDVLNDTGLPASLDGIIADIDVSIRGMQKDLATRTVGALQATVSYLKAKLSREQQTAGSGDATPVERQEALDGFNRTRKELESAERALAKRVNTPGNSTGDAANTAITLSREVERITLDAQTNAAMADKLKKGLLKVTDSHKLWMATLNEQTKAADLAYTTAKEKADEPLQANKVAYANAKANYQNEWTASSQAYEINKRGETTLSIEKFNTLITSATLLEAQLNDEIAALRMRQATELTKLETNWKEQGGMARPATAADREAALNGQDMPAKAKAELEKSEKDYIELLAKERDLTKETVALDKEKAGFAVSRAEAKAKEDPQTIGGALKQGWGNYADQVGFSKSALAMLKDDVPAALGAAQGAFSTFLGDVLTKTKSVGDAFKAMAVTVLKALADIAMKEAASGLFKMGISLAMGLAGAIGGGGGVTNGNASAAVGPTSSAPAPQMTSDFWTGGSIRKAFSGYGVPSRTRDSVPILAAPGEFIMRQSAVDLIGADTLSAMNAAGNSRVSQSPANANQSNDNKKDNTTVNVWVVSPDQQPPMGPNDVVAHIAQNMRNGGSLKTLVKSIQTGEV